MKDTQTMKVSSTDLLVLMNGVDLYVRTYGYKVMDRSSRDSKLSILGLYLQLGDIALKFQEELGDEADQETTVELMNGRASIQLLIDSITGGKKDGTN